MVGMGFVVVVVDGRMVGRGYVRDVDMMVLAYISSRSMDRMGYRSSTWR